MKSPNVKVMFAYLEVKVAYSAWINDKTQMFLKCFNVNNWFIGSLVVRNAQFTKEIIQLPI